MMFFHENKKLILGAAVGLGIWLCIVFMAINSNWALQAQKLKDTESARQNWDGYFTPKAGQKQLPKKDAENEIELSNAKLRENLHVLQHIEFGNVDSLKQFEEAAAGSGDKKSYFIQQRTMVEQKSITQWYLKVPPDLDMVSRADDPVSLNLVRLALVDRFLLSAKEAGIQRVVKIKYDTPTVIEPPEIKADTNSKDKDAKEAKYDPKGDTKKGGKPAPAAEVQEKLMQFPIRVTVVGPERAVAQLLFEVQRQTDSSHGYFCINSVRVEINDAATGTVKATLGLSALLTDKNANDMQIKLKSPAGGGNGNGTGGGGDDDRPSKNVDPDKY